MESILTACRKLLNDEAETIVSGGMESMSRAPHYLLNSRNGAKLGNMNLIDSIVHDGLWDPYNDLHMGACAESCASPHRPELRRQAP